MCRVGIRRSEVARVDDLGVIGGASLARRGARPVEVSTTFADSSWNTILTDDSFDFYDHAELWAATYPKNHAYPYCYTGTRRRASIKTYRIREVDLDLFVTPEEARYGGSVKVGVHATDASGRDRDLSPDLPLEMEAHFYGERLPGSLHDTASGEEGTTLSGVRYGDLEDGAVEFHADRKVYAFDDLASVTTTSEDTTEIAGGGVAFEVLGAWAELVLDRNTIRTGEASVLTMTVHDRLGELPLDPETEFAAFADYDGLPAGDLVNTRTGERDPDEVSATLDDLRNGRVRFEPGAWTVSREAPPELGKLSVLEKEADAAVPPRSEAVWREHLFERLGPLLEARREGQPLAYRRLDLEPWELETNDGPIVPVPLAGHGARTSTDSTAGRSQLREVRLGAIGGSWFLSALNAEADLSIEEVEIEGLIVSASPETVTYGQEAVLDVIPLDVEGTPFDAPPNTAFNLYLDGWGAQAGTLRRTDTGERRPFLDQVPLSLLQAGGVIFEVYDPAEPSAARPAPDERTPLERREGPEQNTARGDLPEAMIFAELDENPGVTGIASVGLAIPYLDMEIEDAELEPLQETTVRLRLRVPLELEWPLDVSGTLWPSIHAFNLTSSTGGPTAVAAGQFVDPITGETSTWDGGTITFNLPATDYSLLDRDETWELRFIAGPLEGTGGLESGTYFASFYGVLLDLDQPATYISHQGAFVGVPIEVEEQGALQLVLPANVVPAGTLEGVTVRAANSDGPLADHPITVTAKWVEGSGNHLHNGSGRRSPEQNAMGEFEAPDGSKSRGSIVSNTNGAGVLLLDYLAPAWGGEVLIKAEATIDGRVRRAADTLRVHVPGLQELQAGADWVLIGATPNHNDNHWGTAEVVEAMQNIAQDWRRDFPDEHVLQINDMSLPWGGMFDISGEWSPSHHTHREGRDVDVRTALSGVRDGIPLDYARGLPENRPFERIARRSGGDAEVHGAGTSNEHYHIDFD